MSFSVSCFLCVHGADRWQVKSKMTTCSTGRKTERTKCTATLTAAFLELLLMLMTALIVYPQWVFVVWKMLSVPQMYYELSTANLILSGWKWLAAFTVLYWQNPKPTHAWSLNTLLCWPVEVTVPLLYLHNCPCIFSSTVANSGSTPKITNYKQLTTLQLNLQAIVWDGLYLYSANFFCFFLRRPKYNHSFQLIVVIVALAANQVNQVFLIP